VIVVVVIPLMVVETSLTMDLEAPPPPDPELPPADCDDAVDDVAAADEVDDVDDVADVAEDDVAALDGVAITAAVEDAIALIDMKTSSEGTLRAQRWRDLFLPSTADAREAGAVRSKKTTARTRICAFDGATNPSAARCGVFPPVQMVRAQLPPLSGRHEWTVIPSHVRVTWSVAGEFSRARRDQ